MNEKTFTDSICTLSWIDKATGLPEEDGAGPPSVILGSKVTTVDDSLPFRFLSLLEATIAVNASFPPRIVSSSWTPASKIYQNPSYAKIKSEAFEMKQSKTQQAD